MNLKLDPTQIKRLFLPGKNLLIAILTVLEKFAEILCNREIFY